jgi:RNA polymerase sigma factor (sigma-70 family)
MRSALSARRSRSAPRSFRPLWCRRRCIEQPNSRANLALPSWAERGDGVACGRTYTAAVPGSAPDEATDEELFAAHVAGDAEAFERLFMRHAARMYGVMRQRGLEHADSQDLVQQTFLLAHQARRDFRPGSKLRPWLWTIAFNLMRKAYQRKGRVTGQGERSSPSESGRAHAADEAQLGVRQAIAQLPGPQQEVILLHWYEGLSFSEIGLVLRASEGAVKVRAHRAYEKLRGILEESLDVGGR